MCWFAGDDSLHSTSAFVLRAGILLMVLWLALPDIEKLPWWAGLLVIGSATSAWYFSGRFKIILPMAIGAMIALLLLRPRKKSPVGAVREKRKPAQR
jgi:hypothetical protein